MKTTYEELVQQSLAELDEEFPGPRITPDMLPVPPRARPERKPPLFSRRNIALFAAGFLAAGVSGVFLQIRYGIDFLFVIAAYVLLAFPRLFMSDTRGGR
ncbi:MAG: hypothetical protein LBI67_08960 [Treponema sp.]|jgi:hypothetical protein|nr:hypothetical protein [Treponema sp.]